MRVHIDPFGQARLVADQPPQLAFAAHSPACRRRSSAGRGHRDSCAPGRRPGAARRWSCRCPPNRRRAPGRCSRARPTAAASGCRKTVHFSHGIVEGALQLLDVAHDAEAALGVGMIERIGHGGDRLGTLRLAAGRQFQQRLSSLARADGRPAPAACPRSASRTSSSHSAGTP